MSDITREYLASILDYDPLTGVFTWKHRDDIAQRQNTRLAGTVAGYVLPSGYRVIGINGVSYLAHRLAWMCVFGKWVPKDTDHINCVRDDNRIANLRPASRRQNNCNRAIGKNNKTGFKGVSWNSASRKFVAGIKSNGKSKHLGRYDDASEAYAAYCRASKKYHGNFARI